MDTRAASRLDTGVGGRESVMLLVGEREHHLCGLLLMQENGSVWGCEWFHCLIQVLSSGIGSRVPAWGQHMPVCVGWDGGLSRWMEMIDMR